MARGQTCMKIVAEEKMVPTTRWKAQAGNAFCFPVGMRRMVARMHPQDRTVRAGARGR